VSSPVYGKWPGVVAEYDAPARMFRVRVDGVTDGSNVLPHAEVEYPIGDRAHASDSKDHTELRVLVGDMVWVEFMGGDPRFPIITGHRLKRAGNPVGWRRWRHANIEMTADGDMVFNAGRVIWNVDGDVIEHIGGDRTTDIAGKEQTDVTGQQISTAATSRHTSTTHLLIANTTISGSINTIAGPGGAVGMTIRGPVRMEGSTYEIVNMTVTYSGSTITSNGKKIDHTHTHNENNNAGGPSQPPNA
jgi:hypothetical protein